MSRFPLRRSLRTLSLAVACVCFGLVVVSAASPVAAATNPFKGVECSGAAANSPVCHASNADPLTGSNGVIVKATHLVAIAAGFAAVVIIVISGINFITSGGDTSKVAGARNTLINACIGLAIIVLADAIITFIVSKV
jgi:Type IV secretion system pilin